MLNMQTKPRILCDFFWFLRLGRCDCVTRNI